MSKKINKKRNKTRKIDSAAAANTKVEKIIIDDKVGCITVHNSLTHLKNRLRPQI